MSAVNWPALFDPKLPPGTREQIKEKMAAQKKSEMPAGYQPPNVALDPVVPGSKTVYDIFESSDAYKAQQSGTSKTPGEAYENVMHGYRESFTNTLEAYQKIFDECDKDIAYCEDLIKNNIDSEQQEFYEQLLSNAKLRRKNIAEQAEYQLSSKLEFITKMVDETTRIMKRLNFGTEEEQKISQIESKYKMNELFARLNKIDLSILLEEPEKANSVFNNLVKILSDR